MAKELHDKKYCGAKKRQGTGTCTRPSGWGTDHVGSGRCKLHGGSSTGPKTPEGKEKSSQNARKHAAYSRIVWDNLTDHEKDMYNQFYDYNIQKHGLDEDDPVQVVSLHRAAMLMIKTARLEKWETEKEFVPYDGGSDPEGNVIPRRKPIYNEQGEVIGHETGKVVEIKSYKNAPPWETHFQNYMKLLGIDRASNIKADRDKNNIQTAVDGFGWLWGQKSKEGE